MTRRSSFSTQMPLLNSLAFWMKKVAGLACRPTSLLTVISCVYMIQLSFSIPSHFSSFQTSYNIPLLSYLLFCMPSTAFFTNISQNCLKATQPFGSLRHFSQGLYRDFRHFEGSCPPLRDFFRHFVQNRRESLPSPVLRRSPVPLHTAQGRPLRSAPVPFSNLLNNSPP